MSRAHLQTSTRVTASVWVRWLVLALALSACGCAGSRSTSMRAKPEPEASSGLAPAAAEPYAEGQARSPRDRAGERPAAPAKRSWPQATPESAADEQEAQRLRRRPGLATRWGERRESSIREVGFEREDASHPFAVVSFYYDDEQGVERVTGRDEDHAYPGVLSVDGGNLTISLVEPDDDPLPVITAGGRHHVIGDSGDRYAIKVQNHTSERFEVVASVDGLDVLDGSDAGYHQRGYLVEPWGTLRIEGYRESYDTVRAFRFGDVSDSYAVRRGRGRDVGVVGVALFAERGSHRRMPDPYRGSADPFPNRFAPPPAY